jgi:LysR family transcriptional activator of nhaA
MADCMFNYNHLYYFYMTAKLGGVMNAAKHLRIAQPSLTAQIKTLEAELKISLFHKVGRRLSLTPDGQRAFGHCRKIFEAAEEFYDHLEHSDSSRAHRCRIGVTREIDRPFIADILSTVLRNKSPREQPLLSMTSDDHAKLIERLKIGELDAVITNTPVYGPDICILSELLMPVVAMAAPSMAKKFGSKKAEPLQSILKDNDIGFILPSESLKLRIETDLFLQKLKLRNRVVFESDLLAVVVRAAIDGVGVAFLPKPYIAWELKHGLLVPLGKEKVLWQHRIFIATRNVKVTAPTIAEIRKHFLAIGA